tara:strand:+ start:945 stop:1259 length:315 start_codon:yes stop_codon:yes gene_type:complete
MEILTWIIAAYGITNILVYGSIFENLRDKIIIKSDFFGDLIQCMMCTSTWVGFFFSLTFFSPTESMVIIPYSNIFFDGMLASGGVWALNAVVEWFEENKPPKKD